MKKALLAAALVACSVGAMTSPAWAASGSGGGTSTGGGSTTPTGGGGGGGTKTPCSPSITLTTTVATVPGVRSLTASFATNCASKSRVVLTATNLATGVTEWNAPVDSINTSYSWGGPLFGATYRVDAKLYSNLGPFLAGTSNTVTTLSAPADCGPFLTVDASSDANAVITVTPTLVWCAGTSSLQVSATNVATGVVEWQSYAAGSVPSSFVNARFSTEYRIDVRAYDSFGLLAQSSASVTTTAAPPNCATIVNENLSAGYWGIYAAVWVSTTAKDCGYGRTSVHLRITNMSSGAVEYDNYYVPLVSMIDFEGPIVKYDTDYQVDVEVRGAANEVLDSSSRTIHTPVRR